MKTLVQRMNFSTHRNPGEAIEIKKWHDVNHYETLCLYCANNDIDLKNIEDDDFFAASEIMQEHGQDDKSTDSYFFWIDG